MISVPAIFARFCGPGAPAAEGREFDPARKIVGRERHVGGHRVELFRAGSQLPVLRRYPVPEGPAFVLRQRHEGFGLRRVLDVSSA